ncbi:MAG TPA: hypothetical protein PKK06_01975 [Phycisphaerae bacterium]|nr:hypothetical protein [Phycisphaerae bacterium]HNU44107.1 hypothetical protein [Phycisphaerae bacterium]
MTRNVLLVAVVLAFGVTALAQESEVTRVTTTTQVVGGEYDLMAPWNFDDATPLATRQVDLRLRIEYVTESADSFGYQWYRLGRWGKWTKGPKHAYAGDDDFILSNSLLWGCCPNVEFTIDTYHNLGDGVWTGDGLDGNHDVKLGMLWRLIEDQEMWPAVALQFKGRFPTGYHSSGVDGEGRLILTHQCTDWLRGHFNLFGITVNGNNDIDARDFQWGAVIGADGPLGSSNALRWVLDYMNRSSEHYGVSNMNLAEAGWEWTINPEHKLAMGVYAGLDDNEDTPNFGARLNYAYSIRY